MRGHGLAEQVRGDPVEAGGCEGTRRSAQVLERSRQPPSGAGDTGWSSRIAPVTFMRPARLRSIATHPRGSTSVRVPASVQVVLTTRPRPRTRTAVARTSIVPAARSTASRPGRRARRGAGQGTSSTPPGRGDLGRSPAARGWRNWGTVGARGALLAGRHRPEGLDRVLGTGAGTGPSQGDLLESNGGAELQVGLR